MSDIAGTYTVIVTDCNGCTRVCTVVIAEPSELSVGTSNECNYVRILTGPAVAVVEAARHHTYLWSKIRHHECCNGLLPGTYTVTVNDANGCGPVTAQAIILHRSGYVFYYCHYEYVQWLPQWNSYGNSRRRKWLIQYHMEYSANSKPQQRPRAWQQVRISNSNGWFGMPH
ncbi:MAG: hypothetical protein IPP29_20805 [Bacteroidetes bacterium]|nr:hypothetical protein [Bacteroidota bacterium]